MILLGTLNYLKINLTGLILFVTFHPQNSWNFNYGIPNF